MNSRMQVLKADLLRDCTTIAEEIKALEARDSQQESEQETLLAWKVQLEVKQAELKEVELCIEAATLQAHIKNGFTTKLEGERYYKPHIFHKDRHLQKIEVVKELVVLSQMELTNSMQLAKFIADYNRLCRTHAAIEPTTEPDLLKFGGSKVGALLRDNYPHHLENELIALVDRERIEDALTIELLVNKSAILDEYQLTREPEPTGSFAAHYHERKVSEMSHPSKPSAKWRKFLQAMDAALLRGEWQQFYEATLLDCQKNIMQRNAILKEMSGKQDQDSNKAVASLAISIITRQFLDALLCEEKKFFVSIIHANRTADRASVYSAVSSSVTPDWLDQQLILDRFEPDMLNGALYEKLDLLIRGEVVDISEIIRVIAEHKQHIQDAIETLNPVEQKADTTHDMHLKDSTHNSYKRPALMKWEKLCVPLLDKLEKDVKAVVELLENRERVMVEVEGNTSKIVKDAEDILSKRVSKIAAGQSFRR